MASGPADEDAFRPRNSRDATSPEFGRSHRAQQPAGDELTLSRRGWRRVVELSALAAVAIAAVGFRFYTRSPLWLDEALSANIAKLPLGDIAGALRHDGHPPLYYYLLHFWMDLFGHSDAAVRSLSGVFGIMLFPLMWLAGRRLGGQRAAISAVLVLALSPYAIRYSTETRMYAMVMVLSLAAWLVADRALEEPTSARLLGLALLTGALLWTHYWAMWLLGSAAGALLVHGWRARRAGRTAELHRTIKVFGALVVGGLMFLPWVPQLLYQSAHTGTPWARPVRPTELLAQSALDLGGGLPGEAVLLAVMLVILVLLGLFGRAIDGRHIELDLTTRPEARPFLIVVAGTLAIGSITSYATGSAFATRYLAVVVPLLLLGAGLGLVRFAGAGAFRVVAVVLLVLGGVGGVRNVVTERTQARVTATAFRQHEKPDDLVVICPDQLGPALSRELPSDADVVTYPDFARPQLVDWTDYQERIDRSDPEEFARQVVARAGKRTIWYAWAGTYRTHKGICERVLNTMVQDRPWATNPVIDTGEEYFEHEALWRLPAVQGG